MASTRNRDMVGPLKSSKEGCHRVFDRSTVVKGKPLLSLEEVQNYFII